MAQVAILMLSCTHHQGLGRWGWLVLTDTQNSSGDGCLSSGFLRMALADSCGCLGADWTSRPVRLYCSFFSRLPETPLFPSALDLEGAHEEQRVVDLDCFRLWCSLSFVPRSAMECRRRPPFVSCTQIPLKAASSPSYWCRRALYLGRKKRIFKAQLKTRLITTSVSKLLGRTGRRFKTRNDKAQSAPWKQRKRSLKQS